MFIVKVGGGKDINLDYICEDFASLIKKEAAILVHGASYKRGEIAKKLGHPTKTVISPSGISSVYTDSKALEIFLMVYAGLVNKQIVAKLQKFGVNAVGLSGLDGRIWEGKRKGKILIQEEGKTKLLTGNLTGKVEKINVGFIKLLLDNGFCPVICPPAISYKNEIINVDNDRAIAVMAKELGVKKLVLLFEAPGFLRDPDDESTLISHIKKEKVDEYLKFAAGRMKKKILGIREAIEAGVEEIYLGDGRIKNPISLALQGKGTVIS